MRPKRSRLFLLWLVIGLLADGVAAVLGFVYRAYMALVHASDGLLLHSGWWPQSLHLGTVSIIRDWGGRMLDYGGAHYSLEHPAFGGIGNNTFNNAAALQSLFDKLETDGGCGFIPAKPFKIKGPVTANGKFDMKGAGPKSAIIVDMRDEDDLPDTTVDAVTLNTGSVGVMMFGIHWRDFAILGEATSCKNALVLNRVHHSKFDLHVKAGAAEYCVVVNGCLISRFRLTISHNQPYTGYIAQTYAAMGQIGQLLVKRDAPNLMPVNNCFFDLNIEGGSSWGCRVEDQDGQGNSTFRGCIESTSKTGFYAKNARGLWLTDLHAEGNGLVSERNIELEDCQVPRIGPDVLCKEAGSVPASGELKLTNCSGAKIDGLHVDILTIDATSARTKLGQITYTTIDDLSKQSEIEGPLVALGSANVSNLPSGGVNDGGHIAEGGNFEYWPGGDTAAPFGWSFVGTPPTWAKVDGSGGTHINFSRFAARVTTPDAATGPSWPLSLARVKGRWCVISIWVYVGTGSPAVNAELWIDGGDPVVSGMSTGATKDDFVHLMSTFFVPDDAVSAEFVLRTSGGGGTFTIADGTPEIGTVGPHTVTPPANAHESIYVGGRRWTEAPAMPTSGAWRKGDKVWNSDPASGAAVLGWRRLTNTTGAEHVLNVDWDEM